jgi:hypothetical protein
VSRLTVTRDVSMIAAAASLVWLVLNEVREYGAAGSPWATAGPARFPAGIADLPVLPPAPHGWLQPTGRWQHQDAVRPALAAEASAYTQARAIDPAGMVARSYDDQLLLPGQSGYGTASRYFHVTSDRDGGSGATEPAEGGSRHRHRTESARRD